MVSLVLTSLGFLPLLCADHDTRGQCNLEDWEERVSVESDLYTFRHDK